MRIYAPLVALPLVAECASPGKIWHFTDIHVDPIYIVGSDIYAYCNGNVTDGVNKAGAWGEPAGDCATPLKLYNSAVNFMNSRTNSDDSNFDFVFFTGDYTQAGLPTQGDVINTIARTWSILEDALPGMPLYGCVGNHDSYPGNQFPYPFDLYYSIAAVWDNFLPPDSKKTVEDGGYYSLSPPNRDEVRIISINTMYLVNLNSHVTDEDDPAHAFGYTMLDWFESELKLATSKNQNIYVLGHIPPHAGFWLDDHLLVSSQHDAPGERVAKTLCSLKFVSKSILKHCPCTSRTFSNFLSSATKI